MAALTATNPRWKYNEGGRACMSKERRIIDGAATYLAGGLLYDKSDGFVYECASDEDAIKYMALADLSSATGDETIYTTIARLGTDDVLEMNELDNAVTEAMVGIFYALSVANHICTLDTGDAGTAAKNALYLVKPVWRDEQFLNDSTDTLARVLVKITPAALHLAS